MSRYLRPFPDDKTTALPSADTHPLSRPLPQTPAAGIGTMTGFDDDDPGSAPAGSPRTGDRYLTVEELAAIYGVSKKTIYRRVKAGLLRKAQIGGRVVRVEISELDRLR